MTNKKKMEDIVIMIILPMWASLLVFAGIKHYYKTPFYDVIFLMWTVITLTSIVFMAWINTEKMR